MYLYCRECNSRFTLSEAVSRIDDHIEEDLGNIRCDRL
ncbi:dual CXXC motif small (seleno)protein [Desulfonatronospira sp.]